MSRAIVRLGASAWTMASQQTHASFGHMWRITRKLIRAVSLHMKK